MIKHDEDGLFSEIEDTVWASDRAFFKSNPRREYRLRPAFQVELREITEVNKAPPHDPGLGNCWWIAVYQLAPGVRTRLPFVAPHNNDMNTNEKTAKRVFRDLCKGNATLEKLSKAGPDFRKIVGA